MSYLVRTLAVVFFGIVGVNALFYFLQESLLFFPSKKSLSECYLVNQPQISYIEKSSVRYLRTNKKNTLASLIVFHGNASTACHGVHYIQEFSKEPIDIILAEYPGYSGDEGELSEENLLKNSQQLFDLISKDGKQIFLYGESLGTGVATYLAANNKVDGLLLNSPYTSITDVAKIHYPFLFVSWLNKNHFESKKWAKKVKVRPIIFQGTHDQVIPIENIELQRKNFASEPMYFPIKNGGHNDLFVFPTVFSEAKRYIVERLNK